MAILTRSPGSILTVSPLGCPAFHWCMLRLFGKFLRETFPVCASDKAAIDGNKLNMTNILDLNLHTNE